MQARRRKAHLRDHRSRPRRRCRPPGPRLLRPRPHPRPSTRARPPARELETRVPDGFTLAAVGDLITTQPLAQTLPADPDFAAVVKILRDADAAFGNFENDRDRPRAVHGLVRIRATTTGLWPRRPRSSGTCGRSASTWCPGRTTTRWTGDSRGCARPAAGWTTPASSMPAIGENRGRRPGRALPRGATARIGLVSMASTYRDYPMRCRRTGRAPADPASTRCARRGPYVVTPETLRAAARRQARRSSAPARLARSRPPRPRTASTAERRRTGELTVLGTTLPDRRAGRASGTR